VEQSPFYSNINNYIRSWEEKNVKTVVAVTIDKKSIKRMEKIKNLWSNFIFAVGWHPWKIKKSPDQEEYDFIANIAKTSKFVGEIGLDYHFIENTDLYQYQEEVFSFMLDIADQNKLPCTIHTKGAENEILYILKTHGIDPGKVILHWYSGPMDLVKKFIDLGCNFSLTPAIGYSKHKKVAEIVPLEHLLTESDGPVKYQGSRGDPISILKVLEDLATIKNRNLVEISAEIKQNAKKFF
jgi:TatD DNase family protein